jgi:hypothetical protein
MIISNFSPLLFSKTSKNGRSFGRITVRHRGSGFPSRLVIMFNLNYFSNFNYLLARFFNFSRHNYSINNIFFLSKNLNKLIFFNTKIYSSFAVFNSYLNNYKQLLPTFTFFSTSFFTHYFKKELFNEEDEFNLLNLSPYRTHFLNVTNGCYINQIRSQKFNQFKTIIYSKAFFSYSRFIRKIGSYSYVKLPSSKIVLFSTFSTFNFYGYGERLRSPKFLYVNFGKAGFNRNLGFRPSVRGVAMNPIDHPHGGRTGESRPSVSPWAILTKGYPTVRKKTFALRQLFLLIMKNVTFNYTNSFINRYTSHNSFESFFLLFSDFENLDLNNLVFKRSFLIFSFFSTFRFQFYRGNQNKSFIVKPYHTGNKAGAFVFTRYQSIKIHTRPKKKKLQTKKRRLYKKQLYHL